MNGPVKFEPHVRMFWSNTVDVILQRPGGGNNPGKVGSFTTYGKIMSFVMRFFFGIQFEQIQLEGRIHYVRPKEWEELRRNVSSQNDDVEKMLNDAIGQVKAIVPLSFEIPASIPADLGVNTAKVPTLVSEARKRGQDAPLAVNLGIGTITPLPKPPGQQRIDILTVEPSETPASVPASPNVNTVEVRAVVNPNGRQDAPRATNLGIGAIAPLPQPPVQQKINILSLYPHKIIMKLDDLEAAALGNEFQPVHDADENTRAAILFRAGTVRLEIPEFEALLAEKNLANTPLAVVICSRSTDTSKSAKPGGTILANLPLLNKKHRIFHLIGTDLGVNRCDWNARQCKEIQHFLKNETLVQA